MGIANIVAMGIAIAILTGIAITATPMGIEEKSVKQQPKRNLRFFCAKKGLFREVLFSLSAPRRAARVSNARIRVKATIYRQNDAGDEAAGFTIEQE